MAVRRFFTGYLVIAIYGADTEKFINLACNHGFPLWDICCGKELAVFSTDIDVFFALRHLARRTGCRLRIKRKVGWPFFCNQLQRRRGLLPGFLLFIAALYFFSSFVLFIRVEGAETLGQDRIIAAAEKAGLRPGMAKAALDKERLATTLLFLEPELAWAGVRIKGTLVLIEVVEKNRPPAGNGLPAHLVAARDGLIVDVLLVTGEARVKPGETVSRGQLLIEGVLSPSRDYPVAPLPVRARGEVWARVWYEGYGEASLQETTPHRTGRHTATWALVVGGNEVVRVGRAGTSFLHFDVETNTQRLPERIAPVPVEIIKTIKHELYLQTRVFTYEQALALASQRAREQAMLLLPAAVQFKDIGLQEVKTEDSQTLRVRYTLETIENIVQVQELVGGG